MCNRSLSHLFETEVSPGRAQAQVKMIRNDAVGQQLPTGALAGLEQRALEHDLCALRFKDERTVVTAIDNVIDRVTTLDARFASHPATIKRSKNRSIFYFCVLTPFQA